MKSLINEHVEGQINDEIDVNNKYLPCRLCHQALQVVLGVPLHPVLHGKIIILMYFFFVSYENEIFSYKTCRLTGRPGMPIGPEIPL